MEREGRGREGGEGDGSMHPLGFWKVDAYVNISFIQSPTLVNQVRQTPFLLTDPMPALLTSRDYMQQTVRLIGWSGEQ